MKALGKFAAREFGGGETLMLLRVELSNRLSFGSSMMVKIMEQ